MSRTKNRDPLADLVIASVPAEIRTTLTEEQLGAVRTAIEKSVEKRRHSIDVRFTVPLPFSSYYFVLLVGRDSRRSTVAVQEERRARASRRAASFMGAICFAALFIAALGVLYVIKSRIGIDLFSFHVSDLLPVIQ